MYDPKKKKKSLSQCLAKRKKTLRQMAKLTEKKKIGSRVNININTKK